MEAVRARANQATARAGLATAELAYRDARPTAPFAGTLANRLPDPGTSVTAGSLLARVVDITSLRIRAEFSEQDLAHIQVGSPARIVVESHGLSFGGYVTAVGPAADPASFLFPVEVTVRNDPEHPLRGGMVARVEVVTRNWENAPLLPVDALVDGADGPGYYVVEDGTASWRSATVIARSGDHLVLGDGAAPGEAVVVLGQTRLTPGTAVMVEEQP